MYVKVQSAAKETATMVKPPVMPSAILKRLDEKAAAGEELPEVISMIDKLAKNGVIHKNKAANLKSKLTKRVNKLA